MKYKDFKNRFSNHPYFTTSVFGGISDSPMVLLNQVNKWCVSGEVVKLRRGIYTLNDDDRKAGLSKRLTSNILCSPSYISLESALSYYGMIPEAVFAVTAVTVKKTNRFVNKFGSFLYKNIKENAFFGYTIVKDEFQYDILMATPEKALLDYFYFYAKSNDNFSIDYFEENLRLQNLEQLDVNKLLEFAKKMNSKKTLAAAEKLVEFLKEGALL